MTTQQRPLPWSPWALIGLACSVGLCPVVTMLGVVFGIFALRDIQRGQRRGRGVAIAAIFIGLVFTPTTTMALFWWNTKVRDPMLQGPVEAIKAGQAGNLDLFREGFIEGSGSGSDAQQFLQRLGDQYGTLVAIRQDPDREASWAPEGWAISVPYILEFTRESVPGRARFVILDPRNGQEGLVFRFAWIRVGESALLTYPPGAETDMETATGVEDAR